MMDERTSMLELVYGASWIATVAVDVAFVVVAATVVRRHRPDAFKPLLWWAIGSLTYGVLGNLASVLVPFMVAADGVDAVVKVQAIRTGVGIVVHLALSVLLVRGLIALAQPRRPVEVEGAPPYR